MRVSRLGLAVAAAIAAVAPDASASEGRTSSLSWVRLPGADACIATQALARAVEDRLGRPGRVFVSAAQADVSVEGRIEPKKKVGWHAVVSIRDAQGALLGTRELDRDDPSCEAMNEPLAFVIAVMIDPEAALAHREAPPAPAASTTEPAPPATPPTSAASSAASAASSAPPPADRSATPLPPPRPREPWRLEGGADGVVAFGMLPGVSPGAGVYGMLLPPGIPVGFRGFGTLYPAVFGTNGATKDGASASFDMLYVGGSLCPTIRGRVNLMGCLGGLLGAMRPHADTPGRGIDESLLPVWNAIAELRTSFTIVSPIGATAGVAGMLPLLRPEVDFRQTAGGSASLFQVSRLAATADVGIGFVAP